MLHLVNLESDILVMKGQKNRMKANQNYHHKSKEKLVGSVKKSKGELKRQWRDCTGTLFEKPFYFTIFTINKIKIKQADRESFVEIQLVPLPLYQIEGAK